MNNTSVNGSYRKLFVANDLSDFVGTDQMLQNEWPTLLALSKASS